MPALDLGWIEALAFVGHGEKEVSCSNLEIGLRLDAAGMAHQVVDGLLEDQEDLTPDIGAGYEFVQPILSLKPEVDAASGTDLACKLAHPLGQGTDTVLFWIDRPDNVAHRINQFAGRARYVGEGIPPFGAEVVVLAPGDFAHDRDLRQTGADIIMQVCSDPYADSFDLEELPDPKSQESIDRRTSHNGG